MPDTCPLCGGEMLDDTLPGGRPTVRCATNGRFEYCRCWYEVVRDRPALGGGLTLIAHTPENALRIKAMIEQSDGTFVAAKLEGG